MPKMMMNEGTRNAMRLAAAGNQAAGAGAHFLRPAEAIVTRLLALLGAGNISVQATASMVNPVDGTIHLSASALSHLHRFSATLEVPVKGGLLSVNEDSIKADLLKAMEDAKKITVAASDNAPKAMEIPIDLGQLVANRSGNLVFFRHNHLPQWAHTALTASLTTEDGRTSVRKDVLDSLTIHASEMGFVAKMDSENFKLPIAEAELPRALSPRHAFQAALQQAQEQAPSEAVLKAEDIAFRLRTHGAQPVGIKASQAEPFDSRRSMLETAARGVAGPAAIMWATRNAKGEKPTIVAMDMASVKADLHGLAEGSAVVQVRFYANQGVQEVTLDVPLVAGKVAFEKVERTAADLEAEKKRQEDLRILSEQEAAQQMEALIADKKKAGEIEAKFGVLADLHAGASGYGQNFFIQRAADKIPVLKALMPAGIEAGKHLLVDGYVYRVDATSYNSTDELHSAFWQLTLTDLPPSKADAYYKPL